MAVHSRLMTPGPLLVWSGQERLATISTNAGSWNHGPGVLGKGSPDEGGELKHIFDENPMTFWHSHHSFVNKPKILKIEFKVSRMANSRRFWHRLSRKQLVEKTFRKSSTILIFENQEF